MQKEIRDLINAHNAAKSTGPKTDAGKQRASMNAFKHGLTGNRILLQVHEHEAYQQLTKALTRDLQPKGELERQLVQKLIDCHTRLNRIAALDGNILNFSLTQNETEAQHGGSTEEADALETIAAQCRSWIENADSFEKLGRYEARISRQLLQYTAELERLQKIRQNREMWDEIRAQRESVPPAEPAENETPAPESASFGRKPPTSEPDQATQPPHPVQSRNDPTPITSNG